MNTFNRFIVALFCLAAILFWIAVMLIIWVLPGEVLVALRDTAVLLRNNTLLVQGSFTAFGVSSILVALLILAGELSPQNTGTIRLRQVKGGAAGITVEAITQQIKYDVEQLSDVSMARPRVRSHRDAVDVLIELRTNPAAMLLAKADEVCQTARDTVEQKLGLQLRNVQVTFNNANVQRSRQAASAPIASAASAPAASVPTTSASAEEPQSAERVVVPGPEEELPQRELPEPPTEERPRS